MVDVSRTARVQLKATQLYLSEPPKIMTFTDILLQIESNLIYTHCFAYPNISVTQTHLRPTCLDVTFFCMTKQCQSECVPSSMETKVTDNPIQSWLPLLAKFRVSDPPLLAMYWLCTTSLWTLIPNALILPFPVLVLRSCYELVRMRLLFYKLVNS